MGPILDHLNAKFKELYSPSQDICVDESLILWKGLLSIKQYIKTKSARFELKTLNLCESSTGYLWNFFIYLGKSVLTGKYIEKIYSKHRQFCKPLFMRTIAGNPFPFLRRGHEA